VLITITILATLVAIIAAMITWHGAHAGRQAVVLARRERMKDHWRRLAEAVDAVRRTAEAYEEAMACQLALVNGREASAQRSEAVQSAARAYREACARLAVTLASGPTPKRWRDQLPILLDRHRPEQVAHSNVAEGLVEEIGRIQDRLTREEEASLRASASSMGELAERWRWRAAAGWHVMRLWLVNMRRAPDNGIGPDDGMDM
jgi:hypothetical protein